ncbi:helix-hairpin-helix domain-containing protein [Actinoallomurus rhizosphaericola]|uniref:helix-hairpin-helix domain-containing protein n=1 Tax=Actinoallomurus rhizosphaericola TaxID=2952536 RepID=UPI002092FEC2|nr:helix-hairpin-helix domain-containing protein [Actinoallomurus rhizosphaericola]MCO5998567.1 helix-hairpin-helix domain-containing protein [Actinoallomurus rhizosphaericola]
MRPTLPPEQIRAILNSAIMRQASLGWRVQAQSDVQAVMASGGQVNHVLHLVITLLLCGLWLPIWIILAITGTEKRLTITVDPYGVLLYNGRPVTPMGPPMVAPPGPPGPPPGNVNAQAVAAANQRRDLRQKAREQAAADIVLARELRIGRPDLPRQYDDGGLIDVNHVPPQVLTLFSGVTPELAEHIARIRDHVGGFSSAEELAATADLHPDLMPEIAEYAVFLP